MKDPPDGSYAQSAAEAASDLVLRVPETAILPEGATFYEGEDDGRCRLLRADGTRCNGVRMRRYGLCPGHAGVGGVALDPHGTSATAARNRSERRQRRLLLGVSARRGAEPVQLARMAMQERAEDVARGLVDDVLDDEQLSSVVRQGALVKAVELLYPQVSAQLSVEVPEDQDGIAGLDWEQLSALARTHLGEGYQQGTTVLADPHG